MCPYVIISDILMEELSINRNTYRYIYIHSYYRFPSTHTEILTPPKGHTYDYIRIYNAYTIKKKLCIVDKDIRLDSK